MEGDSDEVWVLGNYQGVKCIGVVGIGRGPSKAKLRLEKIPREESTCDCKSRGGERFSSMNLPWFSESFSFFLDFAGESLQRESMHFLLKILNGGISVGGNSRHHSGTHIGCGVRGPFSTSLSPQGSLEMGRRDDSKEEIPTTSFTLERRSLHISLY